MLAPRERPCYAAFTSTMPKTIRYARLPTEQQHPRSRHLDQLSIPALLTLVHREDAQALRAVTNALPHIARAVRLVTTALSREGRLFFVGAGTSGRLGVLEAAECPPTFHTPPSMIQAIIAGGRGAVFRSREGAEDRRAKASRVIRQRIRVGDVVVGIAASGVTPFVDEALLTATRRGAQTILITCHTRSPIRAHVRIILPVGPEILTGSTRLKAGTATKLVLNMLTLGAMVQLGKTYGNLMVDVRPTSKKLHARGRQIIQTVTGCSDQAAARYLRAAHGHVKTAIVMATHRISYQDAQRQLTRANGVLRRALHLERTRKR